MDKQGQWIDKTVLVTGGASFIGSHLTDKMVDLGAKVTVVDDLSSGRLENLEKSKSKIRFLKKDLEYITRAEMLSLFRDQNIVFHMAAVHGGRGYIQTHPADVCSNLSIDHHVFEAAALNKVENLVFASTACVYPDELQSVVGSEYKLKESDSDPTKLDSYLSADIEYGWSKLMSEIQLNAFMKQYGMKGCSVRFVSAFGPRENETHAIIALVAKAVHKMDPYPIWGDGQQERDFTYVDDIVEGTIKAAERITDGTPVNLGTGNRYKIIEVVETICKILGWKPSKFEFKRSMPVGPLSRALNNTRAEKLLEWNPRFSLEEGLQKTIHWYTNRDIPTEHNSKIHEDMLMERRSRV